MKIRRKVRLQPPPATLLRLLDAAENERDRAYMAAAINTALRANELLALTIGSVDLEGGWLHVVITKTQEEDLVPITSDLDTALRRWLTTYASEVDRPLRSDDLLFPARRGNVYRWYLDDGGQRVRGRAPASWCPEKRMTHAQRVVQSALRAVGLPTKGEGTHTLRRAVARAFFDSMAHEVGYDAALRTVSALLHHKSVATTELYLGLTSERKRRDERLRGRPFLTAMTEEDNVVPLHGSAS